MSSNKTKKEIIAIASGGTGGHIFPALEVALNFSKQQNLNHKYDILWLGEPHSLESKVCKNHKINFLGIKLKKIRNKGLIQKIIISFSVLISIFRCYQLIKNQPIKKIIAFGGYVSFPYAIACKLKGISLLIHEQNSIAGITNKILSFFAKKIFIGFESSFKNYSNPKKIVYSGNPVRSEILEINQEGNKYHHFKEKRIIRILIFGGSLGARSLNQKLPIIISELAKKIKEEYLIKVVHQYGKLGDAPVYQNCEFETFEFIDNMASVYDWADMVVCRSGASSVAEVESIGIFTLFIPYPFAVDQHQLMNAKQSINSQTRFVLSQDALNEVNFTGVFNHLIDLKNSAKNSANWQFIATENQAKKQFYQNTLKPIIKELSQS